MTVVCGSPHIPYARFQAALRAGQLAFIRRHAGQLTLSLADEAEVCRLIAAQEPGQLEEASAGWIKRYAAEAKDQRRSDYLVILRAFDLLKVEPELAIGQLKALCTVRGLNR
jgi:hypothetical protein